jgi:hydrogenase maturation protease
VGVENSILILGIGNVLWADEGFGVRAVETLHRHYEFPDNVTVMDGGTQGLYLLQYVQEADILVVFDAIDYGLEPGTMKLIEGDAVPSFLGAKKMSLHQTGFQEVLATAEMLGDYPQHLLLVGVQPVELEDYGGSLRPQMKAQIQPAIDAALSWLQEHGVHTKLRETPLSSEHSLAGSAIDMDRYEHERPSEEEACRHGDSRVLESPMYKVEPRPHSIDDSVSVDVDHRGKY